MQHAANKPLSGDSAIETYTSFSLRTTWFDNQFDIKELFTGYYTAKLQFRTARTGGDLVKTMHSRNLVYPYDANGVAWTDFATLLVGVDHRVTISLNARDTAALDAYDNLWYDLLVIPGEIHVETYTIILDPLIGYDDDNECGRGEIYDDTVPGSARFIALIGDLDPGDIIAIENSTDNDGHYGVLGATLTHSVRQRVITLDGLLEGSAEANVGMTLKRIVPNLGAASRLQEGFVEIDHGMAQQL